MTLRYCDTHEWVQEGSDNLATVGISQHAKELLGDVVYVELPTVGKIVSRGEVVGVVESVKAASDYYTPVSGEIIFVNEALKDDTQLLNDSPEGAGWLYKIKLHTPSELNDLLIKDAYQQLITG